MRITISGKDYIKIDESNVNDEKLLSIPKIHIIKLQFKSVNGYNINTVIKNFPNTNRFVISDNVREYNLLLKTVGKKFYVENTIDIPLISFFRKNNKILLNLNNLRKYEKDFILNESIFVDVLKNIEVIQVNRRDFDIMLPLFEQWNGNIIMSN